MNTPAQVLWIDATTELPDDDIEVLIALQDGEVSTGFRDATQWRYSSADLIEIQVTHWADFPAPPNTSMSDPEHAERRW